MPLLPALLSTALAAPLPAEAVDEQTLALLAADQVPAALRRIRQDLARADDPEARLAILCLLGRVERRAGQEEAAVRTLAQVPLQAPCGRRAAFDRADALLALGRAEEAARLYEEAGTGSLGDGRDLELARRIDGLVQRLRANPEASPDQALRLQALALSLALPAEERLRRAVELAERALAEGRETGRPGAAEVLVARLRDPAPLALDEEPHLRRLAARLVGGAEGEALLTGLPDDPPSLRARAEVLRSLDPARAIAALQAALGQQEEPALRAELARALQEEARLAEAIEAWTPLQAGEGPLAAEATLALARAHLGLDPASEAALTLLDDWLRRFPAGAERQQVEALAFQTGLQRARRSGDPQRYDELIRRATDPSLRPELLHEAATAAWARGEPEEARARWSGLLGSDPDSEAAAHAVRALAELQAAQGEEPAAVEAWLRELRQRGGRLAWAAEEELARLREVELSAEVSADLDPRRPVVRVRARNLTELRLRLHRIDPEAWLRAGAAPEDLAHLDVAVIAADREWTEALPPAPAGRLQEVELPIRAPGPGIYALTLAGPEQEVSVLLFLGEARMVGRGRGPDLVLGVLRGDRPAAGQRLLVAHGGRVEAVRTDGQGLARLRVPEGEALAISDGPAGPALLHLRWAAADPSPPPVRVSLDLEHTVALPGQSLGFRLVGRRGDAPLAGEWVLQVEQEGRRLPEQRLRADARGLLHGELAMPALTGTARLWGLPPGELQPIELGRIAIERPGEPARQVELRSEPTGAWAEVREADGRPVPGARLALADGGALQTDEAGRVALPAPRPGLARPAPPRLPGAALVLDDTTGAPAPAPLRLHPVQDRLRPGEAGRLVIEGGEGPLRIAILPALAVPLPAEAPAPPGGGLTPARLEGFRAWSGEAPSEPQAPVWGRPVWIEVDRQGAATVEVALPALPEGEVRLVALARDPRQPSAEAALRVEATGPRLGALPAGVAARQVLELQAEGPLLLTAEGQGIEAAALVGRTGGLSLEAPAEDFELRLVATAADGRVHARELAVQAELRVELLLEEDAAGPVLRARVLDPAGRPVAAQLAITAEDRRLSSWGAVRSLRARDLGWRRLGPGAGASFAGLLHRGLAEEIASALLQEEARAAERAQAQAAAEGRFAGSLFAQAMESEVIGLGGLGTRGTGGGGSGHGTGLGRWGTLAARTGGPLSRAALPDALRDRWLWRVLETDARGELRLPLGALPPVGLELRVSAANAAGVGRARLELDGRDTVFLVAAPLRPAGPRDLVRPVVHVVNGADTPFRGLLRAPGLEVPLDLAAGLTRPVELPPLRPGERLQVELLDPAGRLLRRQELHLPLAQGEPDARGELLHVALAPGGGPPILDLLVEREARATGEPAEAIELARAALAAQEALRGEERERARAMAWRQLQAARGMHDQVEAVEDRARYLLLLAEARAALPEAEIALAELKAEAERLEVEATESPDRALAVLAQARAGLPLDEARLGRLVRDAASLQPEARAALARALIARHRTAEARPLVEGEGVQAGLARMELGEARTTLPALRTGELAEWTRLAARVPRGGKAPAVVLVDGREVGRLDPRLGGRVEVLVGPTAHVEVRDAPGAFVHRGALPGGALPVATSQAPLGLDGRPLPPGESAEDCGSAAQPCRLGLGERLYLDALPGPRRHIPAGLRWTGTSIAAEQPGDYEISGLLAWGAQGLESAAPLHVQVLPEPTVQLAPLTALALAAQQEQVGAFDPALLAPWPGWDDWSVELRAEAMGLRFRHALREADPAARVAAFEDLRDADPEAELELAQVGEVARAYAASGRADRAVAAWRAGLGAAFLAEAGPLREVEDELGRVIGLKAMRELGQRYPSVEVVEEAAFHLPERLAALIDEGIPPALQAEGVTPTDLRLMAAAWDREFLALHPQAALAPEAGLHLAQGLLRLNAWPAAAEQASLLARRYPQSGVLDALAYVEALARLELGQDTRARQLLDELARGRWPTGDGRMAPAGLAPDATYALARSADARGRREEAIALYEEASAAFPEALSALQTLREVRLDVPPLTVLDAGAPLRLPVRVANASTIHLRTYRLDLRTVFLRDGGTQAAHEISVAGVSPEWSGQQRVPLDPFPATRELDLPARGVGAWLVQLDAEGQTGSALVVRSALRLEQREEPEGQRLRIRRGEVPAAGAEVRAIDGSGRVFATRADLRGVAVVPSGAAVLVFDGEDLALGDPRPAPAPPAWPAAAPPSDPGDLLRNLDRRLQEQRMRNEADYEEMTAPAQGARLKAERL